MGDNLQSYKRNGESDLGDGYYSLQDLNESEEVSWEFNLDLKLVEKLSDEMVWCFSGKGTSAEFPGNCFHNAKAPSSYSQPAEQQPAR